eukprot:gene36702-42849_t
MLIVGTLSMVELEKREDAIDAHHQLPVVVLVGVLFNAISLGFKARVALEYGQRKIALVRLRAELDEVRRRCPTPPPTADAELDEVRRRCPTPPPTADAELAGGAPRRPPRPTRSSPALDEVRSALSVRAPPTAEAPGVTASGEGLAEMDPADRAAALALCGGLRTAEGAPTKDGRGRAPQTEGSVPSYDNKAEN